MMWAGFIRGLKRRVSAIGLWRATGQLVQRRASSATNQEWQFVTPILFSSYALIGSNTRNGFKYPALATQFLYHCLLPLFQHCVSL